MSELGFNDLPAHTCMSYGAEGLLSAFVKTLVELKKSCLLLQTTWESADNLLTTCFILSLEERVALIIT